jgi:prevent-host-death family protein
MTAKEAKNNFGKLVEDSQREPVVIKKHGRPARVLMSAEEYRQVNLQQLRAHLAKGEQEAERGEFVDLSLDDLLKELSVES